MASRPIVSWSAHTDHRMRKKTIRRTMTGERESLTILHHTSRTRRSGGEYDGFPVYPTGRSVSPGAAFLARDQSASQLRPRSVCLGDGYRRALPLSDGLAQAITRGGLGWHPLAERVWRSWRHVDRATDLPRRVGTRMCPPSYERAGADHGWTGDHALGDGGAEDTVLAEDSLRGGAVV